MLKYELAFIMCPCLLAISAPSVREPSCCWRLSAEYERAIAFEETGPYGCTLRYIPVLLAYRT